MSDDLPTNVVIVEAVEKKVLSSEIQNLLAKSKERF